MMPTSGQEIEKRSDFGPISVSFSVRGPTPPLNDRSAIEKISRAVHFGLFWSTLVHSGLVGCSQARTSSVRLWKPNSGTHKLYRVNFGSSFPC
jgi:hypothetical protein